MERNSNLQSNQIPNTEINPPSFTDETSSSSQPRKRRRVSKQSKSDAKVNRKKHKNPRSKRITSQETPEAREFRKKKLREKAMM